MMGYYRLYMQMRARMHVQKRRRWGLRNHQNHRPQRRPFTTFQEAEMHKVYNGMPATELDGVVWRKSRRSNSKGNCVELAELPGGDVAVRNSRHPGGPALIYTHAEMEALVLGAKDGDFDHLLR
jgi:hypothetical protein